MKKHLFLFLILFIAGCESIDMDERTTSQQTPFDVSIKTGPSFNVDIRTATYFAEIHAQNKKLKSIDPIVYEGDTVMYLINFENNKGWMILSADKRIEPVLTMHTEGNYTEENSHDGINIWFNSIAEDISYLKKNSTENTNQEAYEIWAKIDKAANITPEVQSYYEKKYGIIPADHYEIVNKNGRPVAEIKTRYADSYQDQYIYLVRRFISTRVVDTENKTVSLLPTKWGQGSPWNNGQFPHVRNNEGAWVTPPAGCTAVAMAQVLYSLHYNIGKPNGLYHNVSHYGFIYDSKNYDTQINRSSYNTNSPLWDQMALGYWEDSSQKTSIVGDLLEDIGYRVGMNYKYDGSGATATPSHFSQWGITCDEGDYSAITVLAQVRKNRVVFMDGYATKKKTGIWPFNKTVYSDGHAWVIDGYIEEKTKYIDTYRWELTTRCPQDYNDGDYYDPYHPCNDPYYGSGDNDPWNPCTKPCNPYIYPGDSYDELGNLTDWDYEHYPSEEEEVVSQYTSTLITMNWGYDSIYDGPYSAYSNNNFNANKNYQYKQRIIYNFR